MAPQEEEIDIKRYFYLLLRRWYWLVICFVMGATAAFFYSRYQVPTYQTDTSIIIPGEKNSFDLESMFQQSFMGKNSTEVLNEVEILRSYTLNHEVVSNLGWRTLWYKKGTFRWQGLYMHEPFMVQENKNGSNAEGIFVNILPIDENNYQISVKGKGIIQKARSFITKAHVIEFDTVGAFGQPFKNSYFDFTLYPHKESKASIQGQEFRFQFSNTNKTTFHYTKKVKIEPLDKESEIIRITSEGAEPLREIHYVNELVRVYLNRKYDLQTQTQKRSLEFIDNQLSGISDSLSIAEKGVTEFRAKNQIIDPGTQGEYVMEQLADIEREKSQQQMQYDYFLNLKSYLGKSEQIKQIVTPSVVGVADPNLNALVMKLSELYGRREILSYSARENNPTVQLLNNEINQTTNQLRENLDNLIDNAKLTIESLNKRYQNINAQLNNLPQKEQELINIRRQYELTSEIYTFLLQRRAEIEIALASTIVDIQIIDPARVERVIPTGRSTKLLIIIGAILGLMIPIGLIILLEMINNKIRLQEDVEKLTTLSIIGNVLHSSSKNELIVVDEPTAPIAESYRTIRTNLQYKFTQPGQKVIGIHSISPSEGKSFNAVNLASILAMNGKKTLIIGADLRKPRLHKIFNVSNRVGLSHYLVGQAPVEEILIESGVDNLWVCPSGATPPNPAELLERDVYLALIEKCKQDFDYIIIDNAPISMVTDGLITSRLSDLNIFILRYAVSRKDQLKYINEIAGKGVMQNPAIVINDIRLDRFNYGYSYAYKYQYKYAYYGKGYKE